MKKYLYTFGLLICLGVAPARLCTSGIEMKRLSVPPFADWNTK